MMRSAMVTIPVVLAALAAMALELRREVETEENCLAVVFRERFERVVEMRLDFLPDTVLWGGGFGFHGGVEVVEFAGFP
jgi:hypothetical protein